MPSMLERSMPRLRRCLCTCTATASVPAIRQQLSRRARRAAPPRRADPRGGRKTDVYVTPVLVHGSAPCLAARCRHAREPSTSTCKLCTCRRTRLVAITRGIAAPTCVAGARRGLRPIHWVRCVPPRTRAESSRRAWGPALRRRPCSSAPGARPWRARATGKARERRLPTSPTCVGTRDIVGNR